MGKIIISDIDLAIAARASLSITRIVLETQDLADKEREALIIKESQTIDKICQKYGCSTEEMEKQIYKFIEKHKL